MIGDGVRLENAGELGRNHQTKPRAHDHQSSETAVLNCKYLSSVCRNHGEGYLYISRALEESGLDMTSDTCKTPFIVVYDVQ
jgi:hypothetical protein